MGALWDTNTYYVCKDLVLCAEAGGAQKTGVPFEVQFIHLGGGGGMKFELSGMDVK